MNLSLNEVEAVSRKAARGTGHHWGICEEAGWAVRWLCSFDLDGCGALVAQLRRSDDSGSGAAAPQKVGQTWRVSGGQICPILAGAAISDFAYVMDPDGWVLESVTNPILLLPFAARVAKRMGSVISVSWNDFESSVGASEFGIRTGLEQLDVTCAGTVNVRPGGTLRNLRPKVHRAWPAPDDWDALVHVASRTYAPATEESRSRGAGGSLIDND